jgi:cytochrome c oxidase cbb3-type subunit 3
MTTEREVDAHSGTQTTGHEWDGIKELDTPLPRWWVIIFYACIAAAIVLWVLYPAWPGLHSYTHGILNRSDRAQVVLDINALKAKRAKLAGRLMAVTPDQAEADVTLYPYALAAGEAAFGDNCATCHGAGGRGAIGYPSLADDVWLWGGTLADIEKTIRVGVRNDNPETRMSMMPAFGRDGLLKTAQIDDLTDYVLSLSGRAHDAAGAARGSGVFAANCVACHGGDGSGNRSLGAPSLRDQVWLYGGSREQVRGQIWSGRGGVMPTWEARLDPSTIRALAIYVHSLGGGEPTIAPPPEGGPAPGAASSGAAAPEGKPVPARDGRTKAGAKAVGPAIGPSPS